METILQHQEQLASKQAKLTPEQEKEFNTRYEQFSKFKVLGIGFDNSDVKLMFKKASQAINAFNMTVKIGCVTGKHFSGKTQLIKERKMEGDE